MSYTTKRERVIPINLKNYINSLSIESTSINDVFTYINKDRVSKYYSLEAMRLDIEKDINMLNKIDMYSLEENIFQKFWEWVKKILKKIVDFFKMLWQKIKSFFKRKKGDAVQKKAQELEKATSGVKSFDPSEYDDMEYRQAEPGPYMDEHYVHYNDGKFAVEFGHRFKTHFPVIDKRKIFENMKTPIHFLLDTYFKENVDNKLIQPSTAFAFAWTDILTRDDSNDEKDIARMKEIGLDMNASFKELKRGQLIYLLIYEDDRLEYQSSREISIYEFFDEDDQLIKDFIKFMADNNLEKDMDRYDTKSIEARIKELEKSYNTLLSNINRVGEANPSYTTDGNDTQRTRYAAIQERIKQQLSYVSKYMEHYQDALLEKCQLVFLFEHIIEMINYPERFKR